MAKPEVGQKVRFTDADGKTEPAVVTAVDTGGDVAETVDVVTLGPLNQRAAKAVPLNAGEEPLPNSWRP